MGFVILKFPLWIRPIKHSIFDKSPDLMEVYNSKVQVPECFIRSINVDSTFELSFFLNPPSLTQRLLFCKAPLAKLIILSRTSLIFPLHSVLVVKNQPVLSVRVTLNQTQKLKRWILMLCLMMKTSLQIKFPCICQRICCQQLMIVELLA